VAACRPPSQATAVNPPQMKEADVAKETQIIPPKGCSAIFSSVKKSERHRAVVRSVWNSPFAGTMTVQDRGDGGGATAGGW
jgi:hypothetical protein